MLRNVMELVDVQPVEVGPGLDGKVPEDPTTVTVGHDFVVRPKKQVADQGKPKLP